MIQIIDGVAYEGKKTGAFVVKGMQVGDHVEISASRQNEWKELDWSPLSVEMYLEALERHRSETVDERAATCAKVAANRAKKKIRHLCKSINADKLLTLTYKVNQTDLALCKVHLKEWVRRVKLIWPEFRAICGFEQQQRGAWHVHMAVARVPQRLVPYEARHKDVKVKSFDVLRAIWRSVVRTGGNIDISGGKHHQKRSPARIAGYISKYITKDYAEGQKWTNRWTRFGEMVQPDNGVIGFCADSLELVQLAYDLCSQHNVINSGFSKWGDWFFLHAELPKPK